MKVLYFGTYDREYPRNAQVISALRAAGVTVTERHHPIWQRRSNWSVGFGQLVRIAQAEGALIRGREHDADIVVVGYPGHFDLPAARRVARGRPLVFNPLVSLYDTLVVDRRRFRAGSAAARMLDLIDRRAFGRPDLVVADTAAHAAFFRERFGLGADRVAVCYIGAEDRLFTPADQPTEPFHALFVGKLIPLHGIDVILEAARLVPEIPLRIVGSGQLDAALDRRPVNVEWTPWITYEALPAAYRSAGCVLGIFGASPKASRVIPNKAFQAIACGRPLITAATPAARELLTDGSDALLVPPADPAALAAAIRALAADAALARRLGDTARQTYERSASEAVLGERWRLLLERLL